MPAPLFRHSRPQDPSLPRSAAAISPSTAPSPFPPPTLRSAARRAVRVCSGLVGFVRLCSGRPEPVPICSLSGRGDFHVVGSVRICSGLFGPVRGGRGRCRSAPYLVGAIFAWSGLFGFVQVCSALFGSVRSVRGGRRRASVGPLCCCGGATVSRRGVEWGAGLEAVRDLGAAHGEIPLFEPGAGSAASAGMTVVEAREWRRGRRLRRRASGRASLGRF